MRLRHFFLPHPETHKKAHLLSFKALIIYILFFLLLQFGLGTLSRVRPDILGISSALNQQDLIRLTNEERAKSGLPALLEDGRLSAAAAAKAQNMFAENYWAHFSPSGKDPWGFINGAGYKFTYAGENLARNFYNSPDVVNAWMASPTHKDNILNSHYRNIGIAIVEGKLDGQDTILVVQEFGTPVESIALAPTIQAAPVPSKTPVSSPSDSPVSTSAPLAQASIPVVNLPIVASEQIKANQGIDGYLALRYIGLGFLFGLFLLILVDLYILRRRAVTRLAGRHLPHLAIITVAASSLANMEPGTITQVAVSIGPLIR